MLNRLFVDHLNKELDGMGAPPAVDERAEVLRRLLKISKSKAQAWLDGRIDPSDPNLVALAKELEVDVNWLLGKSNRP